MYKELEKYKTGEKITLPTNLVHIDGTVSIINYNYDEYDFDLGELMEDFIKHQTLPFWKRKYYHSHLTDIYKRALSEITIKIGL